MADYNTKKPNESKTAWRDEQGNYVYKYPHPALTADAVVFGFDGSQLNVLLIMRKYEPFEGYWALPGGFVRNDETVEEAVKRELREETNLQLSYMEQFHIYSSPERDPRERVVTVAFCALVRSDQCRVQGGDDAAVARWFRARQLPVLAFDHLQIITDALNFLYVKLENEPLAFDLLDKKFTLPQLQTLYEEVTGRKYDRRNFSRKMLQSGFLNRETEDDPFVMPAPNSAECEAEEYCVQKTRRSAHRPAAWFSFAKDNYEKVKKSTKRQRSPFDL